MENNMDYLTIGIEKYDDEFSIPYDKNMTLEEFSNVFEKAIGCKLNIFNFEKKKNMKMKDFVKGNTNICSLKSEKLDEVIKNWKGNFKNYNNSCGRDAHTECIICSLVPKIVQKEEELRKKLGKCVSKDFKSYNHNDKNGKENPLWKDLLELLDIIKEKVKNNDPSPIKNPYDSSNYPINQSYNTYGEYSSKNLEGLCISSTSTSSGLDGGSLQINIHFVNNSSYLKDHEIYLNTKTIISNLIGIEIRNFQKCKKCNWSNISVINVGNIVIPMYDFLNSYEEKSFKGLLNYYYKINNFGVENLKLFQICKNCNNYKMEYYNKISTLPDVLVIDFNLHNYYNNSLDEKLETESFYWVLEEEISLKEHYDRILYDISSKKDCDYELTSFMGHFGNKSNGHFINFCKIFDKWYYFNDLCEKEALQIGDFQYVKEFIRTYTFKIAIGEEEFKSKLKICNCFYERNKCKQYEKYVQMIKKIIKK